MRLIDADKIKYDDIPIANARGIVVTRKAVMQREIENMPTIERKKGKWIERFDDDDKWVMCTNCHKDEDKASPFCPHCGADMREVEE